MSMVKKDDRTDAIDELFATIGEETTSTQTPVPRSTTRPIRTTTVRAVQPRPRNYQASAQTDWIDWLLRFVAFGCFAFGAYFFLTAFSWSPLREHPVARPVRNIVTERRVVTRDIEDFDVGMRAAGRNPLRDQVETAPEPDPETSRKLVIRMKKESGRNLFMKLLRSVSWIEAVGAEEGVSFFLNLPEMGAVGDAYVEALLPCPPIPEGKGNVVTGVFAHEADPDTQILSVTFANGAYLKGVTDNHPFYSVNRNEFVDIGEMDEGETVKVTDGITQIAKIETRYARPGEMLYNLETHNEHVFQVTTAGILVHNRCELDFVRLKRARQLADDIDAHRIFNLTDDELDFVARIRDKKPNIQIFRTNQKDKLGDFLLIDRSNPRSPLGFLVDLKSGGGSAGNQLSNAADASRIFGLKHLETASGSVDELLNLLSRGRAAFPQ